MVEIGAIDCGSNSTRLLISTVENGKLENLHKEHQVTRLSDNIDKTGTISDDSKTVSYTHLTLPTRIRV